MLRMRVALALLCLAFLGAGVAQAQDPRTTSVQQAALAFLALTDRDDGMASWQLAGKQFQNAITDVKWTEALHGVRVPLGSVSERALLSTKFTTNFSGAAAEGDYSLLLFRTSFANRTDARETVTLEREPDGAWRVIGYFIR
jgi:Protein of unknown function (DUF4019)